MKKSEVSADLKQLYDILNRLRKRQGVWTLGKCRKKPVLLPKRGVYFLFDIKEKCLGHQRIVRVGTHAIYGKSQTELWRRLSQHRGKADFSGGSHGGSVLRQLVKGALANKTPGRKSKAREIALEKEVSQYITKKMEVLVVDVSSKPRREYIEGNAIGLLGCVHSICPPSKGWLGNHSDNEKVKSFGLWNRRHITAGYDPEFLKELAGYAKATTFKFPKSS